MAEVVVMYKTPKDSAGGADMLLFDTREA